MHKTGSLSIFFSYFSHICCTIFGIFSHNSLERARHSGHFEPKNGFIRLILKGKGIGKIFLFFQLQSMGLVSKIGW
jgi:hypothetical protein